MCVCVGQRCLHDANMLIAAVIVRDLWVIKALAVVQQDLQLVRKE